MRGFPYERAIAVFVLFLLLLGQRQWVYFRRRLPNLKFTFRITDIWGSMLGFFPSVLALAHAIERTERDEMFLPENWLLVFWCLPSQLFGAFLGVLHAAESAEKNAPRFTIAMLIALYTILGIPIGAAAAILTLIVSDVKEICYLVLTALSAALLVVFSTPLAKKSE